MTPATESYVVIAKDGITLEGATEVSALGAIVELDPESDQAKALVKAKSVKKETAAAKKKRLEGDTKDGDATHAHVQVAGATVRTYSQAEHGDDFAGLAEEFAAHTPNAKVVTSTQAEVDAEAEKVKPKKSAVTHVVVNGQNVRTYSKTEHGSDHAELAAEFAAHTPGATVVEDEA